MRTVLLTLFITFFCLSYAEANCPASASGFLDLVKLNKSGGEGFMERDNCYYELLNLARKSSNPSLTIDIINLKTHLGASGYQSYAEFLEKLAVNQPEKLLDALLNVESHNVLKVFKILDDPLILERIDIEASLIHYQNSNKYSDLLLNHFKFSKN